MLSSAKRRRGCGPGRIPSQSSCGGRGSSHARAGVWGKTGGRRGGAWESQGPDPRAGWGSRRGAGRGGPRGRYLALRAAGGAEGRRALTPGPGPTPDPAPTARSLQPPPPPLSTNPLITPFSSVYLSFCPSPCLPGFSVS